MGSALSLNIASSLTSLRNHDARKVILERDAAQIEKA
jgi:hypothetical protein